MTVGLDKVSTFNLKVNGHCMLNDWDTFSWQIGLPNKQTMFLSVISASIYKLYGSR